MTCGVAPNTRVSGASPITVREAAPNAVPAKLALLPSILTGTGDPGRVGTAEATPAAPGAQLDILVAAPWWTPEGSCM